MPKTKPRRVIYPLTMDGPLYEKIGKAATKHGMSRQAVMRLSVERGLEVLTQQLSAEITVEQP